MCLTACAFCLAVYFAKVASTKCKQDCLDVFDILEGRSAGLHVYIYICIYICIYVYIYIYMCVCVFCFIIQLLPEIFLSLKRIKPNIIMNVHSSSHKMPVIS